MAVDKLVDSTQLDSALTSTANAIRAKTGKTSSISWNVSTGFAAAISDITVPYNQTKTGITPLETAQTITYDSGYTGLNSVQIAAISPMYVGTSVSRKAAATYTPKTTNQTIASGYYLTGVQTIAGSANLTAANIKSGVALFGVTGTYGPKLSTSASVFIRPYTSSIIVNSNSSAIMGFSLSGTVPTGYDINNYFIERVSVYYASANSGIIASNSIGSKILYSPGIIGTSIKGIYLSGSTFSYNGIIINRSTKAIAYSSVYVTIRFFKRG